MKLRIRVVLAAVTLGTAGLVALAGCGAAPAAAVMSPEASVLNAMGFGTPELAPVAETSPGPDASRDRNARRDAVRELRRARVHLRRNTLHGEVTVQTKDGTRVISVQRGTVTAASATSLTVRSTDGFSQTWTLNDKTRVAQNRERAEVAALKVGQKVGVAGAKDGGTTTARLVVIAAS